MRVRSIVRQNNKRLRSVKCQGLMIFLRDKDWPRNNTTRRWMPDSITLTMYSHLLKLASTPMDISKWSSKLRFVIDCRSSAYTGLSGTLVFESDS